MILSHLRLVSNVRVPLLHTDHDTGVLGTADDGGEDTAGGVIAGETWGVLTGGLGFELLCHDIVYFVALLRSAQNSVLNSPALHIPDPLSITRAVCYRVNNRSCCVNSV